MTDDMAGHSKNTSMKLQELRYRLAFMISNPFATSCLKFDHSSFQCPNLYS